MHSKEDIYMVADIIAPALHNMVEELGTFTDEGIVSAIKEAHKRGWVWIKPTSRSSIDLIVQRFLDEHA